MLSALAASLLFTACGSDGGGASPGTSVNLSGVAATGNPIQNASIAYRCANGSGSIAANPSTGAYSATGLQITLPCVLEATGTDSSGTAVTLHSIASGSGSSVTANVTPLTELVVAQLTGTDPTSYFANVQNGTTAASSLGSVITSSAVNDAVTSVVAAVAPMLAGSSQQISAADILSGSLSAGSHSGQDAVLDTLKSTLNTNGTTLATLVAATVSASPANATSTASTGSTSSSDATSGSMLPANLLLQAKAAACASLRSGTYRLVVAGPSPNTDVTTLAADASSGPTLTWQSDGTVEMMSAVSGQSCRYTIGGSDLMVAPSGLVVIRSNMTDSDPGHYRLALLIPVQTMAVGELAGKWSVIGWEPADSPIIQSDIVTITRDGAMTASCPNTSNDNPSAAESACTEAHNAGTLSANTGGSFNISLSGVSVVDSSTRIFAFRAGNGNMVLVFLNAAGEINFLTRYRTLTLPTVGDDNKAWNVQLNPAGIASDALEYNDFLITGASGNSFTRTVSYLLSNQINWQTLSINTARNGWNHRVPSGNTPPAGTAIPAGFTAINAREMYALKLGVGISAYYLPNSSTTGNSNARFGLSVTQP